MAPFHIATNNRTLHRAENVACIGQHSEKTFFQLTATDDSPLPDPGESVSRLIGVLRRRSDAGSELELGVALRRRSNERQQGRGDHVSTRSNNSFSSCSQTTTFRT